MASALRGWSDEYREYPLSFEEYLSFKGVEADKYSEEGKAMMASAFRDYCEEGGFPDARYSLVFLVLARQNLIAQSLGYLYVYCFIITEIHNL